MPWTEEKRFLNLDTPLGESKFLLRSFTGTEGMSQLFRFRLDMLSEDPAISFDSMVGQNLSFSVRLVDTSQARYFNGYVSDFRQYPGEERLTIPDTSAKLSRGSGSSLARPTAASSRI